MLQILTHRVVRSVIILIEQTQGTELPSVPQTTKFHLYRQNHTDGILTFLQASDSEADK